MTIIPCRHFRIRPNLVCYYLVGIPVILLLCFEARASHVFVLGVWGLEVGCACSHLILPVLASSHVFYENARIIVKLASFGVYRCFRKVFGRHAND